eukprot:370215_1
MPVEQMDYLLDKYWYPNLDNNDKNDKQEHQTVDIDIKNLSKKKIKPDASHKLIMQKDQPEHPPPERLHKAPSTTSKTKQNTMYYPFDWSSSCYPDHMRSKMCISKQMKYWEKGVSAVVSTPSIQNQYVTFLKDCGGWNNIRQSFEFHVMVAWVTQRTLVLPPDMPWYLIDFGQITRGKAHADDVYGKGSWPDNKARRYGVSNFDIWFDLDDLRKAVPVITTAEFIRREFDSLDIPIEFSGGDVVNLDKDKASSYQKWLNKKATAMNVNLPWGQLANVLYWPSIKDVESKNSAVIDSAWVDNRKKREYTAFLSAATFIHFPSCAQGAPGDDHEYRFLGQIARSIAFDTKAKDVAFKQVLRDHIHLNAEIMDYAMLVVSILGAFNYASFHIRRNELQYRYVFAEATESYKNVRPLLMDGEVLYIATDELDANYFKVFEEDGKRKVYRWKDFFGPTAQFEQTKNVVIPGKLHGEVEMAICAMGRIFFGTKESTFTQYIGILRGYVGAPYTQTLYHHYPLTKDVEQSSQISKSNPGKPYRGQIYKIAFPELWEDLIFIVN